MQEKKWRNHSKNKIKAKELEERNRQVKFTEKGVKIDE